LYAVLPVRGKKVVNVLSHLIGLVFSIVFIVLSTQLVLMNRTTGQVSMDVGIPLWIIYLVLPLSGLLLALQFAESAVAAWRQPLSELEEEIVQQEVREALEGQKSAMNPTQKGENTHDLDAV
jgi:TRAP-type C4-dicarboxylate transport system permease small subunit